MINSIREIPVYIIHLPERVDRWQRFIQSGVLDYFQNVQRLDAVNGRALSFDKDRRFSVRTRYNILRNYRRSHYEIATMGAVGASMSHINTWKRFYKSGKPMCIIMEDDLGWKPEYAQIIEELYKHLPYDWGMWLIGYHNGIHFQEFNKRQLWDKVVNFTGAHCYLLRRETAKIFLEEPYPVETHIEFYMSAVAALKNVLILRNTQIQIQPAQFSSMEIVDHSDTRHPSKMECPVCSVPDNLKQIYGTVHRTKGGINLGVIPTRSTRRKRHVTKKSSHYIEDVI
jgi:hypothetical protein